MKKHIVAVVGLAFALAPAASADPFRVGVDQTITLKLTAPANSVVIGNATVADVAVHDPSTLLITGKAFGTTNLVVLDRAGRTIYSNQLAVIGTDSSEMTILRGQNTQTFSCIDKCRATPMVGDDPKHFDEVMQTVTGKAAAAKGN